MGDMTTMRHLKTVTSQTVKDINGLFRQLSPQAKNASRAQLLNMVRNPNVEWWVVQDGVNIIGMGILIIFLKSIGTAAEMQEMVVDERYRGRGIGKSLAGKLISRAKARGATHIDLTSNPSRTAANAFYQKLGFEIRKTNVYRLTL
ncbi:MAG: hypothetical protein UY63_C0018G0031 [Parcubacteria group bacterium GW2011_GWA2_51_10]|nr:MAG: hypothetical protein UY63_C0018G0031 [Parcubacteria group bacterium GW2011_GWA2_51_10]